MNHWIELVNKLLRDGELCLGKVPLDGENRYFSHTAPSGSLLGRLSFQWRVIIGDLLARMQGTKSSAPDSNARYLWTIERETSFFACQNATSPAWWPSNRVLWDDRSLFLSLFTAYLEVPTSFNTGNGNHPTKPRKQNKTQVASHGWKLRGSHISTLFLPKFTLPKTKRRGLGAKKSPASCGTFTTLPCPKLPSKNPIFDSLDQQGYRTSIHYQLCQIRAMLGNVAHGLRPQHEVGGRVFRWVSAWGRGGEKKQLLYTAITTCPLRRVVETHHPKG